MPRRNGPGIALLADPTRRRIVAMLAILPQQPSDLARRLSLSRSTVSGHLRLLEEAGLIVRHPTLIDGRATILTLSRRHGAITAWLAGTEVGRSFVDPAEAACLSRPKPDVEDPDIPVGSNHDGLAEAESPALARDGPRPGAGKTSSA